MLAKSTTEELSGPNPKTGYTDTTTILCTKSTAIMPARLSETVRSILLFKFRELEATSGHEPSAYSLYKWGASKVGLKTLDLSKAPAKTTIYRLIAKWKSKSKSVAAAVKDRPRDQTHRGGKRGTTAMSTRDGIVAKATYTTRPGHFRRAVAISKEVGVSETAFEGF